MNFKIKKKELSFEEKLDELFSMYDLVNIADEENLYLGDFMYNKDISNYY